MFLKSASFLCCRMTSDRQLSVSNGPSQNHPDPALKWMVSQTFSNSSLAETSVRRLPYRLRSLCIMIRQTLLLSCLSLLSPLASASPPGIIPVPSSIKEATGPGFEIQTGTSLVATGAEATEVANLLAAQLRKSTGFALPVAASGKGIAFQLDPALAPTLGKEGYSLESGPSGVRIAAATRAGLFYGSQTLLQLLPADALSPKTVSSTAWKIPAVRIHDQPRFAWRGFMLDEARHFFGTEHVKRLIDAMALHKLNRFHWHLTDDEGWRIEIKSWPKLTSVGAWRGTECALPNPRKETDKRYGGFYTQEEIREIVAYAKAREIEIMPEVDLPGHALAIVTAYPELLPEGKGGGVSAQGFTANAISPAKEQTYRFVEDVIKELGTIFPCEYIHIGGDEVNHAAWKDCPQIKELMQREKLSNLHEVQLHFTKRLEKMLSSHGKKIFGWNEILDDRLDRGTGIMAWTGTGPGYAAAKKGFPVVMAPGQHGYFDMIYPGAQGEPQSHWWAGPVDNARVYAFDPMRDGGDLPQAAKDKILGVHAALWTEFVMPWKGDVVELPTHASHADYKTWPRLAALSEVGWSQQANRDYQDFEKRLNRNALHRLGLLGITYRMPVPTATHKNGVITIRPPFAGADVRYTLDGSIPTAKSPKAEGPIPLAGNDPSKLRARTFLDGRGSSMLAGSTPTGVAEWTSKQLAAAPSGVLEFDLSPELTTPGIWRATFQFTQGTHAVNISDVELLVNGTSVSSDPHTGRAGGQHKDNTWRFEVAKVPQRAKVTLRAKLTGDGGKDSNGTITLQKSDRLEPAATVSTTLGGYQASTPEKAADWNDHTFFWTNANPSKDDTVTWTFATPVAARSVGVLTGERGGTKDQATGAVLEYSQDGKSWKQLASYAYGNAEGKLPAGTRLTAIRIRFTDPQNNWVIVHDPVLR